ncbi:hypothetical protein HB943_14730 [Listeria weihenstephanensis]|uniref:Uncharacterized protein n=1 Tax=Listeria weihenstephanensis TaxID=1006155 RepID=A0A841Z9K7_9LIST|nr:hypothetical protein [Listeria weihenstephanensis]MBC1501854.1 hypothetical protein [Listeria weihenstephanensis]
MENPIGYDIYVVEADYTAKKEENTKLANKIESKLSAYLESLERVLSSTDGGINGGQVAKNLFSFKEEVQGLQGYVALVSEEVDEILGEYPEAINTADKELF